MTRWTSKDLPSERGRTVVVTGASSGIGLATAEAFCAAGARVVLAVRDLARGERAIRAIRAAVPAGAAGPLELRHLDLADLASVRAFVESWSGPVDILVNNAGVLAVPLTRTVDGFELQFGVNHLGHFALTNLLLPRLTFRVVTVSSGGHRLGSIDLEDPNWEHRRYRRWAAYGQSKLANLLFTLELQRRLEADGSAVRALAAHPGLAATGLYRPPNPVVRQVGQAVIAALGQSPRMGALPTLYAATMDLPGASYVGPDGPGEHRGHPTLVGRSAAAADAGLAARLWELSEQLTGVRYPASDLRSPA